MTTFRIYTQAPAYPYKRTFARRSWDAYDDALAAAQERANAKGRPCAVAVILKPEQMRIGDSTNLSRITTVEPERKGWVPGKGRA